jgi:hypothetical protein
MEDRFKRILGLLSGEACELQMGLSFSPYVIEGFRDVDRNEYGYRFQLQTGLSLMMKLADSTLEHRNEQTFLNFYPPSSGDNLFTVVIEHYFGQLALRGTDDFNGVELLCTGAYLGITKPQNRTVYASLNSMLHFLSEWNDEQVARVLTFQLAGMFKGLEGNWDDSLIILKRFGDRV